MCQTQTQTQTHTRTHAEQQELIGMILTYEPKARMPLDEWWPAVDAELAERGDMSASTWGETYWRYRSWGLMTPVQCAAEILKDRAATT